MPTYYYYSFSVASFHTCIPLSTLPFTILKNIYPCKNIKLILLSLLILFVCTDSDDHTRVELKKDPELEGSDYINASFIDVRNFEIFNHCDSLS